MTKPRHPVAGRSWIRTNLLHPTRSHGMMPPSHATPGGLMRTIAVTAATLLALTACTAGGGAQAVRSTPSPTATLSPAAIASPTAAAITPACRSKVSDLILENIAGAPVPSERPAQCNGLTDQQWTQVLDEQGKKLLELGGAAASSRATTPAAEPATEAVFKVWGTAKAGASITYGSDSENLEGEGLPMTRTLKVKSDALYLHITAQLQGGGDIHCSVTLGDQTKEGHAQGSYNICSAQINRL